MITREGMAEGEGEVVVEGGGLLAVFRAIPGGRGGCRAGHGLGDEGEGEYGFYGYYDMVGGRELLDYVRTCEAGAERQ